MATDLLFVILDGKHFTNCSFDGTELVFRGKISFSLSNNNFRAIRVTFKDDAALTIEAIIAMYADESFRPIIEHTFDDIKKEALKRSQKQNQTGKS